MIHCQRWRSAPAVGAAHTIATHDVLAREFDLFEGNPQVGAKPNHGRKGVGYAYCANISIRVLLDEFGFRQKQEHQSFLCAADADGFVGLVEDQDLAIER